MASELKAYDIDEHPALVSKAREGEGYFGVLIFRIKMHRLYSKVLERPADFMMKIYSLERILLEDDVRQKVLRSQALWHLTIEEPTVFLYCKGRNSQYDGYYDIERSGGHLQSRTGAV